MYGCLGKYIDHRLPVMIALLAATLLSPGLTRAGVDFRNPDNKYQLFNYLSQKLSQQNMQLLIYRMQEPERGGDQYPRLDILSEFYRFRTSTLGYKVETCYQVLLQLEQTRGQAYEDLFDDIVRGLQAADLRGVAQIIKGVQPLDIGLHLAPPENNRTVLEQMFSILMSDTSFLHQYEHVDKLLTHMYQDRYEQDSSTAQDLPGLRLMHAMETNDTHWFYLIEGLSITGLKGLHDNILSTLSISDDTVRELASQAEKLRSSMEGVISVPLLQQTTEFMNKIVYKERLALALGLPYGATYASTPDVIAKWIKQKGRNAQVGVLIRAIADKAGCANIALSLQIKAQVEGRNLPLTAPVVNK